MNCLNIITKWWEITKSKECNIGSGKDECRVENRLENGYFLWKLCQYIRIEDPYFLFMHIMINVTDYKTNISVNWNHVIWKNKYLEIVHQASIFRHSYPSIQKAVMQCLLHMIYLVKNQWQGKHNFYWT